MVKQSDDICSVTAREYLAVTRDVLDVWEDVYGRELGWFPPGVAVTLKDEYSHRSEYLVAYDDTSGSAVGTLRIVKGVYTPLPIERFVSLQSWLDPAAPKIELTRLMVKDRWRKRASPVYPFGIYRALMRSAFQWSKRNGFEFIVLNVRSRGEMHSIISSLDPYGFVDTHVRIPDEFDSKFPDCTPVFISVSEFFEKNPKSDDPLMRYTASPSEPSDLLIRHSLIPSV